MDHWRGNLSLVKAFWINFVLMRMVLFFLQTTLLGSLEINNNTIWTVFWGCVLFFHIALLIWQIVGVLRSGENYLTQTGSQATVWGAQLGLAFGVFLSLSYAMQAWQATIPTVHKESFADRMNREHADKYNLEVLEGSTILHIDGAIELGITRNLRALVAANPQVKKVILNSTGGNIYEARGLAKIFSEANFSTHVDQNCSSACTSAFAGGVIRSMADGAKFGFHQYRIDADYAVLNISPIEEQKRDIEHFQKKGVSEAFLKKIFSHPSNQMWFPDRAELLASGFIHIIQN